jgi:aminodeoxyfutalosine deaminase
VSSSVDGAAPYPKIELHVHLEGTVRARALFAIAERNGIRLPVDTEPELEELYRYSGFERFSEIWSMTTHAMMTAEDHRKMLTGYAREAAGFGAVYLEVIFSPGERVRWGANWAELFEGACDGISEARDRYGIEVRLTPDVSRDLDGADPVGYGEETARWAVRYRDRGVVGLGLGGDERLPAAPFARAFEIAREGGLGSVPHAGEGKGPASVREVLDLLRADRIRHGILAARDPELLVELAERGIVLDVCPTSNVITHSVKTIEEHPLPSLLAAGVRCSMNTDDPAMFGTDLGREHEIAVRDLGADPRELYFAGVEGALCDDATRERLRAIGEAYDWSAVSPPSPA